MMLNVYPYHRASRSAKALAQELGCKRIRRENSRYRGMPEKDVINWGCTELPAEVRKSRVLNQPEHVRISADKLKWFQQMECRDLTPLYHTDRGEAQLWLDRGLPVIARTLIKSRGGKGIVICEPGDELPEAPLYVRYMPIATEWRVHVMDGKLVDVTQKKRSRQVPDEKVNWRVRNHANGFIFARKDIDPPSMVVEKGVKSIDATGLLFGAADVIVCREDKEAYVLEVNSAPGLEGTTLERYGLAFRTWLRL
jgi:glutathione synthase/RimK-type ligase-like ATP-grasp enzyme